MNYLIFFLLAVSIECLAQPTKKTSMALDSVFRTYFKEGEPGGAALVVKDGKVIFKGGYGIADINTREPITTRTLFNTGSISKTVVAYGILKLAAENKLSLDDDLSKYFPDFKHPEIARKVKIYHLLTHTSGLPDSRKVKEEHDFYLTARDEENFAPIKQTESLEFEPGTKYKYSNPAFNGLALIIEKVSGIKWQEYITREVFRPAGMNSSLITDGPFPESGVSHGYIKNKEGKFEELDYGEEPTFAAAGNGGIWSSVEDFWRYEQAIQEFSFLPQLWIEKSRSIYSLQGWVDKNPSRLGLSWFITREGKYEMIGHTGSQGGFISDYLWIPENKFFYVLLCNTPMPLDEIRRKVFKAVLE